MRVPLMGVVKELQASRMASQLAFMMIEYIRRAAVARLWRDARRDRLDPRGQSGDASIAETIESTVNKVYQIYARDAVTGRAHPADGRVRSLVIWRQRVERRAPAIRCGCGRCAWARASR